MLTLEPLDKLSPLKADIRDLGITGVSRVRVSNIYMLEGGLSREEVPLICRELLADPVVE